MMFNALIPELSVSDIQTSRWFYVTVLGFQIEYERPEDKFIFLSFGQAQLMIEQDNTHWNVGDMTYPRGRGVNFQIETDDVQAISDSLKQHNIKPF